MLKCNFDVRTNKSCILHRCGLQHLKLKMRRKSLYFRVELHNVLEAKESIIKDGCVNNLCFLFMKTNVIPHALLLEKIKPGKINKIYINSGKFYANHNLCEKSNKHEFHCLPIIVNPLIDEYETTFIYFVSFLKLQLGTMRQEIFLQGNDAYIVSQQSIQVLLSLVPCKKHRIFRVGMSCTRCCHIVNYMSKTMNIYNIDPHTYGSFQEAMTHNF